MAEPPAPPGLLSNVLNYVTRELECFVATATGGNPPPPSQAPKASTSRVTLDDSQEAGENRGLRREASVGKKSSGEAAAEKMREETRPGPSRPLKKTGSGSILLRRAVESNNLQAQNSQPAPVKRKEERNTRRIPDAPASRLPPLKSASLSVLQCKTPLTTMPGSLFPRSGSLAPEPTPVPRNDSWPFSRDVSSVRRSLYPSIPEAAEVELRDNEIAPHSPGSSANPFLVEDENPEPARRVVSTNEDAMQFLGEMHPSPRSSPSPMLPPTASPKASASIHQIVEEKPQPLRSRSRSKGKERALDSVYEFLHAETSQEVRIRDKEDELQRALEEHERKEEKRGLDPETTLIIEEGERDKERIKFLEAEVARLRDQLSHQRSATNRTASPPPPPPPPPAPPLPPSKLTIAPSFTVASVRKRLGPSAKGSTDAFLQSARAALRRTGPPTEVSIIAPSTPSRMSKMRRKHVAQPTVNVPSEKMADFLQEVRSAKLKKISDALVPPGIRDDMADRSSHNLGPTGRGRDILRELVRRKSMSNTDARAGEKRKRDATAEEDEFAVPSLPAKRLATRGPLASDVSSSSIASTSSNSFPEQRSFLLADSHNRSWPSISATDTDLTTPSLTSDNENDRISDTSHNLPPTPPRPHRSPEPSKTPHQDDPLPEIIDVDAEEEEEELFFSPNTPSPYAQSHNASPESPFMKRLAAPRAPLDATPKKPRPPARSRLPRRPPPSASESQMQGVANERQEGNHPVPQRRIPTIDLVAARAQVSAQKTTGKGKARADAPAPRQPVTQSRSQTSGKPAPAQPQTETSAHARRRTLDEELRHAGDHLWESDDELESGQLVAVGEKNNHGGFLARGGGGGSPVFMGVGYVQDAVPFDEVRQHSRNNLASVM